MWVSEQRFSLSLPDLWIGQLYSVETFDLRGSKGYCVSKPDWCFEDTSASQARKESTYNSTDQITQRWTSSLDIMWSCGVTMFLCSWSVQCLNVSGPADSRYRVLRRKLYLVALSFLGPQFIFQIALEQWILARRSVADFHASG